MNTIEAVARDLHIDTDAATQLVDTMLSQGVAPVDVFDVIVDGWTPEQYHAEYAKPARRWIPAIFTAAFWISEDPNPGYSALDRADGLGRA